MDIFEFLSRSEWPIVVGGALWIFREPLGGVIDGVRPEKIAGFGLTIDFRKFLDKVDALTSLQEMTSPGSSLDPPLNGTATSSTSSTANPKFIILNSWKHLEERLRPFVEVSGSSFINTSPSSPLNNNDVVALNDLKMLRDKVAYTTELPLTLHDAARYSGLTERVSSKIRNAGD